LRAFDVLHLLTAAPLLAKKSPITGFVRRELATHLECAVRYLPVRNGETSIRCRYTVSYLRNHGLNCGVVADEDASHTPSPTKKPHGHVCST